MSISNVNRSLFHKVDLSLLRHFADVATFGGFTRASRATGVSQPSLSLGVQKLEKSLGVKLVRRGGRHFGLTTEGKELLQFCKRFESGLQSVVDTFGSGAMHGRLLRIGTALSVGFGPLVSFCNRAAKTPRILEIELSAQNTYELIRNVAESQLDAALLPNDVHDPDLSLIPIHRDPVIFVAGPKYASLLARKDWPSRTGEMNLLTYPRETPMRAVVDRLIRENTLHFRKIFSVNNIEALKMLVARNLGGAFVLKSLVLNELKSGHLFQPKRRLIRLQSGVVLATRKDERGAEIAHLILQLLELKHA